MHSEPNQCLTSSKRTAEWTLYEAQVDAFTSVKQSRLEAHVLAFPGVDKPFSAVCNASNFAIGSALMQKDDDGIDCVASYWSRLLNVAELNYPVNDKESFLKIEEKPLEPAL